MAAIFYQIFIHHQMIALQKLWKMCFIPCKKLFWFLRYSDFVFPSSPLFLSVIHCFRGCSKINLKACDVSNCLNKNVITHFVWYLEKEKSYDIETLSINRVLNKEQCRKHAENVHQKLVPDSFLILVNNPKQPFYARNSFKFKIFWKKIIKRPLKKLTFNPF